jgi:hypothetical protein
MDYNPTSAGGNHHIIVVVYNFTKWDEAMPTVKFDGKTATFFYIQSDYSPIWNPKIDCH